MSMTLAGILCTHFACVQSTLIFDPTVLVDESGDAVVRRTDLGNDGAIASESNLPDLARIEFGGWEPDNLQVDPYAGEWEDATDSGIIRVNVIFHGLVNPPGPIGLDEPTFDPFRWGPSPLFGFVEFDLDDLLDTGGEIDTLRHRFLGNVARFGGLPPGELGDRAARGIHDLDDDLTTPPFVERSGEEMHLALCGCDPIAVIDRFGDPTPETFDAGDTWIIQGRFLHRTHAFSEFSFAFGGSRPGEYDPIVDVRFSHDPDRDETTLAVVYAADHDGAARLTGRDPEPMDLNAANQTSILEMLEEIRFAAEQSRDPGFGTSFDLLRDWADNRHKNLSRFVDPQNWKSNALVGASYAEPQPDAFYVWTDVGFDVPFGDLNRDGSVDEEDRNAIAAAIADLDGTYRDADGELNVQIAVEDFGLGFSLYDLDYDGFVNALDLFPIGFGRIGDVDVDGALSQADLQIVRSLDGARRDEGRYNEAADVNRDDRINFRDRRRLRRLMRLGHLPAAP